MELVTQTAKGRVYRTDSGQEAVNFAARFNGSYQWYSTSMAKSGYWMVIIN